MTTSNHADKTKSCSLLLPPAPSLRTLGRRSRCPLRCRPSWAAEPAGCKRARIEADLAHGDERGVGDYLSSEVLEDGGEVDGCTGADMLRVLAGLEVTRDTAPTGNWSPALEDLDTDLVAGFALPRPPPPVELIVALPWGSGSF
jgi:hypothetical protein